PSSEVSSTPWSRSGPVRGSLLSYRPTATQWEAVGQLTFWIDSPLPNGTTVKRLPPSEVTTKCMSEKSIWKPGLIASPVADASPWQLVAVMQLRIMIWPTSAGSGLTVHEGLPFAVLRNTG